MEYNRKKPSRLVKYGLFLTTGAALCTTPVQPKGCDDILREALQTAVTTAVYESFTRVAQNDYVMDNSGLEAKV